MLDRPISIALLINEVEGDYHEILLKGINAASDNLGVNLIVLVGKPLYSPDKYEYNHNISYELINFDKIDGVIVSSGSIAKYTDENQLYMFIKKIPVPVVSISLPFGVSCCVDNRKGFNELINHLINYHNKKHIAFITGPELHSESLERLQVYIDTLHENNLPFNKDLIIHGNFTCASAVEAVSKFLKKGLEFDSIVCSNDEMAIGAIRVLKANNIKVPEEISVTGFDNIPSSSLNHLTTVHQPIYELGYNSVELLFNLITKNKFEVRLLGTQLVIRESCGCKFEKLISEESILPNDENNHSIIEEFVAIAKDILVSSEYETAFKKFFQLLIGHISGKEPSFSVYQLFRHIVDNLTEDNTFLLNDIMKKLKSTLIRNFDCDAVEHCFFDLSNILIEKLAKKSATRSRNVLDSINNLRQVLIYSLISADSLQHEETYFTEKLSEIGLENYYVYMFEKSFIYNVSTTNHYLGNNNIRLLFSNANSDQSTIKFNEIFSNILRNDKSTFLVFPLFSRTNTWA